jgi:hypothetical protein
VKGAMLVLGIVGGWIVLSCVAAPLVGKFIFTNIAECDDAQFEGVGELAPAPTH